MSQRLWDVCVLESWTVIDRGMQATDLNLVSFTKLGVGAVGKCSVIQDLMGRGVIWLTPLDGVVSQSVASCTAG